MASGTEGWRMAKAKKTKPRERLVRWRVSLITKTPAGFVDFALRSRRPGSGTTGRKGAQDQRHVRNRLVAIRDEL